MTKLNASTDSTAKPRAARKVAKPVEAAAPLPEVSDDLLDQYADMLSPVPPPPIANPKVFSARVAAPIDGGDGEAGPESIGLGFAVGLAVTGEALGQGFNLLGRGIHRLLR
jgi:hypothetical protein